MSKLFILFTVSFLLLSCSFVVQSSSTKEIKYETPSFLSLQTKAKEAKVYCKNNSLNATFCILVDMSIHSGYDRMFVWDFTKDTIVDQGLVAHGCGKAAWGEDETAGKPLFSNTPDSHLASVGKYKITNRGYSNWGIHVNYKLKGLEKTNDNAYKRTIVLHSWDMIPASECYPNGTPEGWGCPAVNNQFMKRLDIRLKNKKKDVLLWIYIE